MVNACRSLPGAVMNSITIENFRCFGEKQTARLAPLTLLVGENSTGKTSFLALLRALDDFVQNDVPDFKRPPYDLGSFDEIAHYRGSRGGRAEKFSVEIAALFLEDSLYRRRQKWLVTETYGQGPWRLYVQFCKDIKGTAPIPTCLRISLSDKNKEDNTWIAFDYESPSVKVGTKRGTWNISDRSLLQNKPMHFSERNMISSLLEYDHLKALRQAAISLSSNEKYSDVINMFEPEKDSLEITKIDMQDLSSLNLGILEIIEIFRMEDVDTFPSVFPSAPVRSQPRRTYDPARSHSDPEGNYVPMLLAELSSQQPDVWAHLKQRLEKFGQSSGLFDEIRIRHFGKIHSNPFQVQVKKSGKRRQIKGPWRNLIDVGYGISQALPIITELLLDDVEKLRDDTEQESLASLYQRQCPYPRQFLLQQPEVHLHPSAQAALGSLFCQVAGPRRQLIVETHSDHLMDRVRMDVRDGVSGLKPEDVSILFFERRGLDVRIHSLRLDEQGNVLGAPDGYRQFFMDEMTRSLWPERSSEGSKVEA
ncbi:MAG: AAA family ATPase [Synechococcus sp. SB0676_bin_10]|uniref:AAA family ATPase n=1 Tax=Synechococcus sp. SB0676_bin_10 TaxID=2604869 RepID=A0A6B1F7E7_9SYNE|nr:AAA family ATPase [Synechococcus sp. SB0676_bin_10]MYK07893.1 AAA family ATPase [Synechococcus sp. SB0670_bin_20]